MKSERHPAPHVEYTRRPALPSQVEEAERKLIAALVSLLGPAPPDGREFEKEVGKPKGPRPQP